MTSAEDAINSILTIDYGVSPSDNWGDYSATFGNNSDRDTVRVGLQEEVGPNPAISNFDWIVISEQDPIINHSTTFLEVIEANQLVRIDVRSSGQTRGSALKDYVLTILGDNLTNLDPPWHYMEFANRGVNQSKGKLYRYIITVRLYNIHQNVTI